MASVDYNIVMIRHRREVTTVSFIIVQNLLRREIIHQKVCSLEETLLLLLNRTSIFIVFQRRGQFKVSISSYLELKCSSVNKTRTNSNST